MIKLIMLGTGHGGVLNLYNTCFVVQNEMGNFLVDTGGSIEIRKRLEQNNISLSDIKNIFISHSHTDHILGLIWMLKRIGVMALNGKFKCDINIYCNDVVYEAIRGVSKYLLPSKIIERLDEFVNYVIVNDKDKYIINNIEYEFFDIHAKGTKQFGFECLMNNQRFIFLGDEPLNPILNERVKNADYVMHEAFCLDSEENIFHAYEKNHSTALSTAKIMNELGVKGLILYHTEETHVKERKRLYTEEAKKVFEGNVLVPDDMEVIVIE